MDLKDSITTKKFCKLEKKFKDITFVKKSLRFDDVTMIFFICEKLNCKYKLNCVYLIFNSHYYCHICGEMYLGEPAYKVKPPSRICKGCGEIVSREIPANPRLLIFQEVKNE